MRQIVRVCAAIAVATVGGCRQRPPVAAEPAPRVNEDSLRASRARADSIARAETARRDSIARANAARDDSVRRAAAARSLGEARRDLLAPVHFDFDRSEIGADGRALLDRKVAILTANVGVGLRIEGHTDERGSDEYNLALGMRRAGEARRYLMLHGVDSTRLALASNGEERPVCRDAVEACWQRNRRDEFVVTGGEVRVPPR